MAKVTLNNLTSLTNEQSAISVINANNDKIEAAMEKTLSRDGTSPNSMSALIDMNSNRIVNLPYPIQASEPIRLNEFEPIRDIALSIEASTRRGTTSDLPTRASAILTYIQSGVSYVITQGYTDVGDGGGGLYKKVISQPSHEGKFQSADGAWWELKELKPCPLQFGAKGDGVTNDQTAFQNTLNYAQTYTFAVYCRGKSYVCTSSDLDSYVSVFGENGTVYGRFRINTSYTELNSLHIVSNITGFGVYVRGLESARITDVTLRNVRISFSSSSTPASSRLALYSVYNDNLKVINCHFFYGTELISCRNYLVTDSTFDGENANNNELLQPTLRSWGIISNNHFLNSYDNCIDMYSSGERSIITGNRFIGCRLRLGNIIEIKITLSDNPLNTSSDTNGWDEQMIISNNYFGDSVASSSIFSSFIAIYYLDSRASPSFTWAETPRNILIDGNIFDGFDATNLGVQSVSPIYLSQVTSAIVTNNIIRNIDIGSSGSNYSSGVWIEGCRDVIVQGNRINIKNGSGVTIHTNSSNIVIDSNLMLDDLNKSYVLDMGIRIEKLGSRAAPTITNLTVTNNHIKATTSSFRQPYVSGSSISFLVMKGNTFYNETIATVISDAIITGNIFNCTSTRFGGLQIGTTSTTSTRCIITGNIVTTVSGSEKPGIHITRLSRSTIKDNIMRYTSYGLLVVGTSTAGELEYLNIKDNFSNTQTQTNFPHYSSMHATDTGTIQAVNNQKLS